MARYNVEAIVLKHFKYQDLDKIYTLLSKEKGKISVIGKGVRSISSKRSGNLDTLNVVIIHINESTGGQRYLSEAKSLKTFKNIKDDLNLAKNAFYMVELVNKTVLEDENATQIYELLYKALDKLDKDKYPATVTTNIFEIKLMKLLGYEIPKPILNLWKKGLKEKKYEQIDIVIKNYITEVTQEKFISLNIA